MMLENEKKTDFLDTSPRNLVPFSDEQITPPPQKNIKNFSRLSSIISRANDPSLAN